MTFGSTGPVLPVTAGQAAIWLAEQADSLGPAYNTCTMLRVRGDHELDDLDAACRQVVNETPAKSTLNPSGLRAHQPFRHPARDTQKNVNVFWLDARLRQNLACSVHGKLVGSRNEAGLSGRSGTTLWPSRRILK